MRICASPFCDVGFEPKTHNQIYHKSKCKRDAENVSRRRVATHGTSLLEEEAKIIRGTRALDTSDELDVEAQIEFLRSANKTLSKEVAKLKISRFEMATAVKEAVEDNISKLKFAPTRKPGADKRHKLGETACAVLSDLQIGKKTLDYNVAECEKRIELYADKLLRITEVQRADHPVRHLELWMLGDMVEGEGIFPTQSHHLDKSLYYQVAVDGPRILVNFIRRMLENFETVHIVGVVGNHGAIGGRRNELHPETNADRMLYAVVQRVLENEPRITWDIPDGTLEGDFYVVRPVGRKKFFLFHGHQIGGGSMPVAGIDKKIKGWYMGAAREKFDYALLGHYHTPTRLTINTATVWINGTTETSNGFAVEVLAAVGRPCQYLLFVHPEHGVTSEYCVYLDNDW